MLDVAGALNFIRKLTIMDCLDDSHRKAHVKKLWQTNPRNIINGKLGASD